MNTDPKPPLTDAFGDRESFEDHHSDLFDPKEVHLHDLPTGDYEPEGFEI